MQTEFLLHICFKHTMLHGVNCKCRQNFFYTSVSNVQSYTVLPVNVGRISSKCLFQTYKSTRCQNQKIITLSLNVCVCYILLHIAFLLGIIPALLLVRKYCNSPNVIRQLITLFSQTKGTRFVIRIQALYLY